MDDNKEIMKTMKYMEEKLIELMGEEAYREFALETGKKVFREEIEEMKELMGLKEYVAFVEEVAKQAFVVADEEMRNALMEELKNIAENRYD